MTETTDGRAADAYVAEEIRSHHALMRADLDRLSAALVDAAESGTDPAPARAELTEWIRTTLVPHAEQEEATTYPAAANLPEGRLLIAAMLAEHVLIRRFADLAARTQDPAAAGAYGRAVFETFSSHQAKENEHILPLLVEEPTISLAELMAHGHGSHHGHGHGH
ncbi:hemerythrin domain-containing protein [Georgenia muralis]|uniref:Hemerythrin HHE cation binding domain-containing protein n=1 Tax=Georgenia muralis TaxID=154117 RepID=A0A3N4ZME4_9MICO|nr:hemerythrin domain-containing protein [Georgenia muralis]RPF26948.1 hemerythrin HHE cation binding domain-containing protein [Georgenia muralis]